MASSPAPGWYPDPQDAARQRWWDGGAWTEHVNASLTPGGAPAAERQDPFGWAPASTADTGMAALAHVIAIPSAFIVLAFVGPLIVWLLRQNEPFARAHAAEAVNFQLSTLLYVFLSGVVFVVLFVVTLGVAIVLLPIYLVFGLVWLFLVLRATIAASRGETYRYPLTLRFFA